MPTQKLVQQQRCNSLPALPQEDDGPFCIDQTIGHHFTILGRPILGCLQLEELLRSRRTKWQHFSCRDIGIWPKQNIAKNVL